MCTDSVYRSFAGGDPWVVASGGPSRRASSGASGGVTRSQTTPATKDSGRFCRNCRRGLAVSGRHELGSLSDPTSADSRRTSSNSRCWRARTPATPAMHGCWCQRIAVAVYDSDRHWQSVTVTFDLYMTRKNRKFRTDNSISVIEVLTHVNGLEPAVYRVESKLLFHVSNYLF